MTDASDILASLTMGELAHVEKLSNLPIAALGDDSQPRAAALAALSLVVKRRTGSPDFTWTDAQALTLTDVSELLGLNKDDTETTHDADTPMTT